ncbi:hypothetical protein TeGR_g5091 [Tetraparma gracilis]|uniref:SGNH hydrolase-type esterase domain-containing protein n=1 Tax=Tetraparma gracilis TaxID=2962635 RepID=A0ABQ6N183_9STRA|nr:hypothetical protein TeGR_g5091 [Tetraparma gracilis]
MISSLSSLFSLLTYFYVLVRRLLTVRWISLNLWLRGSPPPVTAKRHKVVVVGDSLAFGLGDWVLPGGSAGLAPGLLQAIALDPQCRQRWHVQNLGVPGSTSKDWLPPGRAGAPAGETTGERAKREEKAAAGKAGQGGRCYERAFGAGSREADAEIVVIALGLADVVRGEAGLPLQAVRRELGSAFPEQELAGVVKNVRALARDLRERGKKVLVLDWPTSGAVVSKYGEGKMKRLNRQLRQVWKSDLLKAGEAADGNKNPCAIVPLGSNHKVMRSANRAFDGLHLNRTGYKLLALDV